MGSGVRAVAHMVRCDSTIIKTVFALVGDSCATAQQALLPLGKLSRGIVAVMDTRESGHNLCRVSLPAPDYSSSLTAYFHHAAPLVLINIMLTKYPTRFNVVSG